jgi:hypothetical protein
MIFENDYDVMLGAIEDKMQSRKDFAITRNQLVILRSVAIIIIFYILLYDIIVRKCNLKNLFFCNRTEYMYVYINQWHLTFRGKKDNVAPIYFSTYIFFLCTKY